MDFCGVISCSDGLALYLEDVTTFLLHFYVNKVRITHAYAHKVLKLRRHCSRKEPCAALLG